MHTKSNSVVLDIGIEKKVIIRCPKQMIFEGKVIEIGGNQKFDAFKHEKRGKMASEILFWENSDAFLEKVYPRLLRLIFFVISQNICIEIPISFGADVEIGGAIIQCGNVSELKNDCGCNCGN